MSIAIDESLMSQSAKYADEIACNSGKTVQTELDEINQNLNELFNLVPLVSSPIYGVGDKQLLDNIDNYKILHFYFVNENTPFAVFQCIQMPVSMFKSISKIVFEINPTGRYYNHLKYVSNTSVTITDNNNTNYRVMIYGQK